MRDRTVRAHQTLAEVLADFRLPRGLRLVRSEIGGSVHPFDTSGPYAIGIYRLDGDRDPLDVRLQTIRLLESQGLRRNLGPDPSFTREYEDTDSCTFRMRGGGRSLYGSLEFVARETRLLGTGSGCPSVESRWRQVFLWLHLEVSRDLFE